MQRSDYDCQLQEQAACRQMVTSDNYTPALPPPHPQQLLQPVSPRQAAAALLAPLTLTPILTCSSGSRRSSESDTDTHRPDNASQGRRKQVSPRRSPVL